MSGLLLAASIALAPALVVCFVLLPTYRANLRAIFVSAQARPAAEPRPVPCLIIPPVADELAMPPEPLTFDSPPPGTPPTPQKSPSGDAMSVQKAILIAGGCIGLGLALVAFVLLVLQGERGYEPALPERSRFTSQVPQKTFDDFYAEAQEHSRARRERRAFEESVTTAIRQAQHDVDMRRWRAGEGPYPNWQPEP